MLHTRNAYGFPFICVQIAFELSCNFYRKQNFTGVMHCFEIKTTNLHYFVGEDPFYGGVNGSNVTLPPSESGIGSHLAKSWETILKHALMPIPSNMSMYLTYLFIIIFLM